MIDTIELSRHACGVLMHVEKDPALSRLDGVTVSAILRAAASILDEHVTAQARIVVFTEALKGARS